MRSVTVQEAKTHLSKLLREVEAGEEIEIRRGDTPIALLSARPKANPLAALKGKFDGQVVIHGDFNDYDEQIARDFGVHPDDD
ncbi:MAG: type II toxin-antitoxin system prevent-host-death family antitoxin [Solirubrobacterales bacterium]|nr:type II toxin-antitoxin system prevent-host-death family antitoxin [Solirubrobacterales bacterium]